MPSNSFHHVSNISFCIRLQEVGSFYISQISFFKFKNFIQHSEKRFHLNFPFTADSLYTPLASYQFVLNPFQIGYNILKLRYRVVRVILRKSRQNEASFLQIMQNCMKHTFPFVSGPKKLMTPALQNSTWFFLDHPWKFHFFFNPVKF